MYLIELKEVSKVLMEQTIKVVYPLPPMPSLAYLAVDVDSIVLNFYTLASKMDETDFNEISRYLLPQKQERVIIQRGMVRISQIKIKR